jgi:ATP-dependent RNA helicase RhlE
LPDLQRILSYLPKQRTTLLFSATFSGDIRKLASSYLSNPVTVEVAQANATAATVKQRFISVSDDDKRRALVQLVREQAEVAGQAFVFVNSKLGCARLARALERDGLQATALHGDKSQDERLKALQAFKAGEVQLLVCTDVAARGLDIKDVPAVFNFDLPFNPEDYVHRIGRTGRAGAEGLAISFVSGSNARQLADIEKLIRLKAELEPMEWSDDRPPRGRHFNDGQRVWRERGERGSERGDRPLRQDAPSATPKAPYDPLFDKPYEPATAAHTPAWDAKAPVVKPRGVSAYIRSRKKVAALFNKPTPESRVQPASLPDEPPGAASGGTPGDAAAAQPSTEASGTTH